MATLRQIISKPRLSKLKNFLSSKLNNKPQKKGICLRFLTIAPKKPNSANRKIVKLNISQYHSKLTAKLPGELSELQQHATVLIKGARVRDLIAVSYKVIPGCLDCSGIHSRKTGRSLYGVKKLNI